MEVLIQQKIIQPKRAIAGVNVTHVLRVAPKIKRGQQDPLTSSSIKF
jgi:hypothetical protein